MVDQRLGGSGIHFQVSGLGSREPGSGVQVRVQVQDLNISPYPHLYLMTRTRDLRAETWDLKMSLGRADHPWSAAVEQGMLDPAHYNRRNPEPAAEG